MYNNIATKSKKYRTECQNIVDRLKLFHELAEYEKDCTCFTPHQFVRRLKIDKGIFSMMQITKKNKINPFECICDDIFFNILSFLMHQQLTNKKMMIKAIISSIRSTIRNPTFKQYLNWKIDMKRKPNDMKWFCYIKFLKRLDGNIPQIKYKANNGKKKEKKRNKTRYSFYHKFMKSRNGKSIYWYDYNEF